jgi:hypothetical protein
MRPFGGPRVAAASPGAKLRRAGSHLPAQAVLLEEKLKNIFYLKANSLQFSTTL